MTISFDDPVKQEIWTTVRAMNDAWTKGNPDDLAKFFHRNMVAITATDRNRLDGGAACIAGWKGFANTARIRRWAEVDPVIHVYDNSAVVAYYFDMSFDMDGRTIDMGGRDMFFLVKETGKWWAVADQFSPYPAFDSPASKLGAEKVQAVPAGQPAKASEKKPAAKKPAAGSAKGN